MPLSENLYAAIEKAAIERATRKISKEASTRAAKYAAEAIRDFVNTTAFEKRVKQEAIRCLMDEFYENCFQEVSPKFMRRWTEKVLSRALK